ncbi:MAG: helix-turn-helix domain-containing protein [Burkholderiales bacterium]
MPRGRPPTPVDPDASAGHRLGHAIRTRRLESGLTLDQLAVRTGYTPQHISEIERAKTSVGEHFVSIVDRALGAGGRLIALHEPVLIERARERSKRASKRARNERGDATVDDARRRAFISLGCAVVLFGPDSAARALTEAEGEQIAHAWGRELFLAPDRQALLPGIAKDLKRLSDSGSHRATAQLSTYVASIAVCGGDTALAERWWRRAQHAANASGDSHLAAYVTGQRAVHALYGGSVVRSLTLADHALRRTTAPCVGRMQALTAKAQALGLLGRKREARDALREAERAFERLPRDITREKVSSSGWAEERLHHTISYTSAFGGIGGGERAREAALALYPPVAWRGQAQVRLHRAAAERDAKLAIATLAELSEPQRSDRGVRLIAIRVLEHVDGRNAADLHELLT